MLAKGAGTAGDVAERKVVDRDEGRGDGGARWKGGGREEPRDQGE